MESFKEVMSNHKLEIIGVMAFILLPLTSWSGSGLVNNVFGPGHYGDDSEEGVQEPTTDITTSTQNFNSIHEESIDSVISLFCEEIREGGTMSIEEIITQEDVQLFKTEIKSRVEADDFSCDNK